MMAPSTIPDDTRGAVREEIIATLGRATAHAAAAGSHATAGSDRAMTMQIQCAAACIVAAAELCADLCRGGRAA